MGSDGLVRETPVRRRRISIALAFALAISIGMLIGTRLPRREVKIWEGPPPMNDFAEYAQQHANIPRLIGRGGACHSGDAREALRQFDPGTNRTGLNVRRACEVLAAGTPGMAVELRAMDGATREGVVATILGWNPDDGELANRIYEIHPEIEPWLFAAAMFNLRRGDEARALVQLRAFVAPLDLSAAPTMNDETRIALLMLEALEARRAGGGNVGR